MTKPSVAIIAQGAMGAAVAGRLAENGIKVLTSLNGRSAASAKRAEAAKMTAVSDDEIANADIILSILPPGDAIALAQRLAPGMTAVKKKPIYADCNAISPDTVEKIGAIVTATGASFVDGAIIGGPPQPGQKGPVFYLSGADAQRTGALQDSGLHVKIIDGPAGAASSLKMSFGGITKCTTALAAAMVLAASRAGVTEALRSELAERVPGVLGWLDQSFPQVYDKAYRFVDEMEEIAAYLDPRKERGIFDGAAEMYKTIAADQKGPKQAVAAMQAFTDLAKKP